MSLLHRWSLPSRGFIRDKPQDGKTSDRTKFPTIHIGQPGPRRRANISSAFSALFEKPENRRSIRDEDDRSQAVADLPPLAHRRENVPPGTDPKYSHAHEYQDSASVGTPSLQQSGGFGPAPKQTETDTFRPLSYQVPGALNQVTHKVNETPKTRPFRLSSTGTNKTGHQDEFHLQESTRSTNDCERIHSTSSSYPSEGILSPVAGFRSPEPATTRSTNYLADYRRYGRYPSQSTWQLSSVATSEASPGATVEERIQAALGAGDSSSSKTFPSVDPLGDYTESTQPGTNRSRYASTIIHREQQQKPLSAGEITVPVLANEDALSSQLEVSFMSYKRPSAGSTSANGNDYPLEARIARSTDRLRQSIDTDRSILTAVRHASVSDGDGAWSTIRGVGEKRLSRPASWMQLFTSTTAHVPATTLTQRIQTLRLRKWAKRVCFKTKARFELVGKPIPKSKRLGVRVRKSKWRHGEEPEEEKEKRELDGW